MHFYCREVIPEKVIKAYDLVDRYMKRFDMLRENFKVDLETNPATIRNEQGKILIGYTGLERLTSSTLSKDEKT